MKKVVIGLLMAMMVFSMVGCGSEEAPGKHEHVWEAATCENPSRCNVCGETVGEASGHKWLEASCAAPQSCERCGKTEGQALAHTWLAATCTAPQRCKVCGKTEGAALGHVYASTVYAPTAEARGYTLYTCNICGNEYADDYTDKLPEKSGSKYGLDLDCYEPGMYKVGVDIEAGEYVLIAVGNSGYFCVSADANKDDIIFNGNFGVNSIITIYDGEYLDLSGCLAVESSVFYELYTVKHEVSGVMLKVGVDIPAGEYKVVCETNKMGYYCIYADTRHDEIINNDNFENSTYVEVKDGEYLVLSRCYIPAV